MTRGAGGPQWDGCQPGDGPHTHLPSSGDALTLKHWCIGPFEGCARFEIVEHLVHASAPDSVRQAVMHLGEESHPTVFQTLDEPDLP